MGGGQAAPRTGCPPKAQSVERRASSRGVVPLDYAAIQALKTADREGTARIFAACGPEVATLIASAEPEAVAKQLLAARQAKVQQRVAVCELLQILTSLLGP